MTPLETLIAAKTESDRRNYARKHALMRELIGRQPDTFAIDSDDGKGILGITHLPTKFKMHLPIGVPPVPLQKLAVDELLESALWAETAAETDRLVKAAAPFALSLPTNGALVWHDPDAGAEHRGPGLPDGFGTRPWVPIKCAGDGALRPLFSAMQMVPNQFNELIGGPTPLAAMGAGGLLGAGLGYGGAKLIEKILGPRVLEPGRLSRVGALLGGALGTVPGAYLGSVGARLNVEDGKPALSAFVEPNALFGKEGVEKAADAGGLFDQTIPVDAFNRVVWSDPNTPGPIRAATTGLLDGARQFQGGAQWVSPFDVGRIAVGMGSGLLSGLLVGKTLGALAGLKPEAQNVLKQTGMWAGALLNVVPKAFGF